MDHVGSDNQDYHMYFTLLLHSEEFRDCYSSTTRIAHCYQTLYHIAASVWSVLMHCFIKELSIWIKEWDLCCFLLKTS